ncbi:uncharacterized protein [Aegilops tauschii subsp. strangulata]|uniref:uncharacterized protein n=1 Tax=Aegilops tauschii subsp. strangulata TaxID=200361 RepID=UPI003CC85E9F
MRVKWSIREFLADHIFHFPGYGTGPGTKQSQKHICIIRECTSDAQRVAMRSSNVELSPYETDWFLSCSWKVEQERRASDLNLSCQEPYVKCMNDQVRFWKSE